MCGMPYLSHRISVPFVAVGAAWAATAPNNTAVNAAAVTRCAQRWKPENALVISALHHSLLHVATLRDHFLPMVAKSVDDAVELSDAFSTGRSGVIGIRFRIRNKRRHGSIS